MSKDSENLLELINRAGYIDKDQCAISDCSTIFQQQTIRRWMTLFTF